MVLILSFNVSAFEFDNVLQYNEQTREGSIVNAFGFGSTLAKVRLNTPLNVIVPEGYHQVMEFNLNMYTDYDDVMRDYTMLNVTDSWTSINRTYDLKYLDYQWVTSLKETNCRTEYDPINESNNWVCDSEELGEWKRVWIDLASDDLSEGDTYTIGVFTTVLKGDYVDVIPSMMGVEISPWATWEQSLNIDLRNYYKLDESSGTTAVDALQRKNLSNNGPATVGSTGIINTAYTFLGAAFLENTTWNSAQGYREFTVNMWIRIGNFNTFSRILSVGNVNNDRFALQFDTSTGDMLCTFDESVGDAGIFCGTEPLLLNQYYMVTLIQNDTFTYLYLNGTLYNFTNRNGYFEDISSGVMQIGAESGGSNFDGRIDEIGMWNRSLTDAEITSLFNNFDPPGLNETDQANRTIITFNSPAAVNFTVSPQDISFNFTATDALNLSTVALFLGKDGIPPSLNQTNATGLNNTAYIFNVTLDDGTYEVFGRVTNNQSFTNDTETRTYIIDSIPPVVTIFSPPTSFGSLLDNQSIDLNFSATDASLDSCFFSYTQMKELTENDGTVYTSTTSSALTGWVFVTDKDTQLWSYNFGDAAAGVMSIRIANVSLEPSVSSQFQLIPQANTSVVNLSMDLFDNGWHYFEIRHSPFAGSTGTADLFKAINPTFNVTNNTVINCLVNTTFLYQLNTNSLTLFVNDSVGFTSNVTVDWNVTIIEINQTFNEIVTEGANEFYAATFIFNSSQTVSSADLIYNGTATSGSVSTAGSTITISTNNIVPGVPSTTNLSFFWSLTLSDSSTINLTTQTQTVVPINLDTCGTFTFVLYNYTMVDEATQVFLDGVGQNTSLELDLQLFTSDKSSLIFNLSTIFNQTNPNLICSDVNLFNASTYVVDSTAKYTSSAREIEYYNIRDAVIQNGSTTQEITLFDIKTDESTTFQITFKNSDFVVVENALIQVNRQFVSEGVFKTVELPITDSNGQTVVHLVKNDVVYNYIVTKNNEVIGLFNNLIAFCEDETIGQCFISLNALEGTEEVFNPDASTGVSFTPLNFNETSRDLKITFSTNDGSVKTVLMSAIKMDQIGNTTVCSSSVSSSSATLTCNIPASIGNETIIVTLFVNGALSSTTFFSAANDIELGAAGLFLLFFLTISLVFMFSESKSMMVIGVILGFVAGTLLYLVEGGILAGATAIIWLIIQGIILIWKLNSEAQT